MNEPILIDGSQGEGGGQILRTSLSLAVALGKSIRVTDIRAGRAKPGLRPQHLSAARAAESICEGELDGATVGSTDMTFRPGPVKPGRSRFDIGTAGSATLVLQTVLPPLALAEGDSEVTVTGGTHNPLAPCFEYLRDICALLLSAMGVQVYFEMARPGFYPTGGGEVHMQVRGIADALNLMPLGLLERGELRYIEGISAVSNSLPEEIADRQSRQVLSRLAAAGHSASIEQATWGSYSPGTVVFLRAVFERTTAGFVSIGAKGKPARQVADDAVDDLLAFLDSSGVVDSHAGDQLLTVVAMCPHTSKYRTERITDHLLTNARIVRQITGREVIIEGTPGESGTVTIL